MIVPPVASGADGEFQLGPLAEGDARLTARCPSGDGPMRVQIEGPPPTTGPDGSFRLEHRAEPCALLVMRPPSPFVRRGIALVAGQTFDLGTITVDAPPAGPGGPPGPGTPPH